MGTPIWGDSPPLCYVAEPIDKASGQNFPIAAALVTTLTTWGCGIFRPSAGFRCSHPDPRVEQINRYALYRSDIIVAYLSEHTPSIGVPAEIEAATARGIPAVVHYTGQSFVLAGNPLVTVIDDVNTLIGAVEHALKEHPRLLELDAPGITEQTDIYGSIVKAYHKLNEHPRHQIGEDQANRLWLAALEQAAYPMYTVTAEPEPIRLVIAEDAQPPARAYPDDAGLDLTTAAELTIQPGEFKDIRTQVLASQLPTGYWGMIVGRSSALRKWRLYIPHAVIDPGWRGPLFVGVWNLGGNPVTIKPGDRVGQLILIPNNPAPVQIVTTVDDHARGLNGFGSSG